MQLQVFLNANDMAEMLEDYLRKKLDNNIEVTEWRSNLESCLTIWYEKTSDKKDDLK